MKWKGGRSRKANLVNHHILGTAIIKLSHHRCNVVISKKFEKALVDKGFKSAQTLRKNCKQILDDTSFKIQGRHTFFKPTKSSTAFIKHCMSNVDTCLTNKSLNLFVH